MAKRLKDDKSFEDQLRRVVMKNMNNLEIWLDALGKTDPGRALKAWSEIAEYIHAKKPRDAKPADNRTININLIPASRDDGNKFIDIPHQEMSEMNTDLIPPSDG
jgi:hypothetical protein